MAGQVAGRALERGAGSAIAHYAAAISLVAGGGSRSEALSHLGFAEKDFPGARLLAARILADTGRRTDAAHEVEAYLRSPGGGSKRPELEAWLSELAR